MRFPSSVNASGRKRQAKDGDDDADDRTLHKQPVFNSIGFSSWGG
jgi:hypothetical protein